VVLATRIYPPDRAAAAFRLGALVRSLEGLGCRVTVLTTRSAAEGSDAWASTSTRLRRWPVMRDRSGYVRGYLPYLSFDLPLTVRLLVVGRPDAVVVEPPPTTAAVVRAVLAVRGVLSRRARAPYVYYAADVWSDASAAAGTSPVVTSALRGLERFALQGADQVIAVSEGVAARVRALGARSVCVVPNGVDTEVFRPEDAAWRSGDHPHPPDGLPPGPFLLYAGTASEWQGAEIFAEAMHEVLRRHPTARLVFLGHGSAWPRLQQLSAQLPKGTIVLRPLVPPPVAAAWHRAASAALASVRPGLDYDFAYPTKVLAALACGTPVVYAGPGPAVEDLRRHRLGTCVPYDRAAVADAMTQALETASDPGEGHRRAQWVRRHRSIEATGAAAAAVVLDSTGRARDPRRAST
jgi:glycosyltransferase involved in cell wall biosynthesis